MRKTRLDGNTTVHGRYLDDYAEAVTIMKHVRDRGETFLGESSLETGNRSWSGTDTLDEAISLAEHGWPEGARLLSDTVKGIDIDDLVGQRHVPVFIPDFGGDEVDIDRYLQGEPENMLRQDVEYDANGKLATLYVNVTNSASVSSERIMRRGAVLLASHELLTRAGYSLGIIAVEAASKNDTHVEYHIPIVEHGQYANVDTLAFCLANPAFLRRLVFTLNENEDDSLRRTMSYVGRGGYGMPTRMALEPRPHSFVIDHEEGLDLPDDESVRELTRHIVDRLVTNTQDPA